MKKTHLLLATCCVTLGTWFLTDRTTASSTVAETNNATVQESREINNNSQNKIYANAGNYLSSRFAQNNHDWVSAEEFLNKITSMDNSPDNIMQRAMILSMGAGKADKSITIAKQIKKDHPDNLNVITEIFIIVDEIIKKDYETAQHLLDNMPYDGTAKFIAPFIKGWLSAAQNKLDIKDLQQSTMQLYHAILISDYLGDHSHIEKMIDRSLKVENISDREKSRIADLYAHVGIKNKAENIYKDILAKNPKNKAIENKLKNIKQKTDKPLFKKINSAQYGLAKAFHDIASILHNEKNDESARVFAHIALHVEPRMMKTKILLAQINTNHKQYKKAVDIYQSIPSTSEEYITAQHGIVDIYETAERFDDALQLLKKLPNADNDADTLIKIGNLYRHQEKYDLALKSYNLAATVIGDKVPDEYWHLHYVRGIAYEQTDNWEKAETELKKALSMRPDHPYILNYLGYAWADKGINLKESLKLIQHAVNLMPSDGYITDSLGWVMYRTKNYKRAVPVLERAVELLPYDPTINDHLGDAYWKVGRLLEAKFQWNRAKNHSTDDDQIKEIEIKLTSGITSHAEK